MTRTFSSLPAAVATLVLTAWFGASILHAQLRDRVPPTAPTNLVVTATTEQSVSLTWNPSTDNSGRFTYVICCAGTTVTVSQTTTSHTLEGLQAGKTYTFRVYAKDGTGNLSRSSNAVTVTLPGQLAAPTKPIVRVLDAGPTHVSLDWSSTDDGPTIWYTISVDGQPVSTVNSRSGTFTCSAVLVPTGCTPLQQETTYAFTVRARDVDGNMSPSSDPAIVTTDPADPDDHTPPAPPVNLTAEADGGHIILRWHPSTDDRTAQTFIRYDVYVNGEPRAVVVGVTRAEVEGDAGANDIAVIAVDTADNESAPATTALVL